MLAAATDPATREQIEIDVVVFAPTEPGTPRRVLSLGEAKWGKRLGLRHLRRLELLGARGFDTRDTRLACYGGAGFDDELLAAAAEDPTVLPINLDRLYAD